MNKHKKIQCIAREIIESFPKSKNREPFLSLKSGRKVFFNIFLHKYGLDGTKSQYSDKDIQRRVRMTEFFDHILKQYHFTYQKTERGNKYYFINTKFFRFVFIELKNKKLELLSFYNHT